MACPNGAGQQLETQMLTIFDGTITWSRDGKLLTLDPNNDDTLTATFTALAA